MTMAGGEALSRVLIDRALVDSGWDLVDPAQVRIEQRTENGRVDYLLLDPNGRPLCVVEAKRAEADPYDAKEQARGYALNLGAPFVLLSNGSQHWFWNLLRIDHEDARRVERFPSRADLIRLQQRSLQPPRPLLSERVSGTYLAALRPDLTLRTYQLAALDEVARGFDDEGRRRFLLEMATGTGKTLLCAALIRRFLVTRNAERVLFIVDRIELANQTMEDFNVVLPEFQPVIFKSARRTGELLGSSVVIATIQSLMVDARYRAEFTPFYFDLVINDEAHRSIYGDAREVVQFFQATRVGLTATPKAYLKNVDVQRLGVEDPRALEARELRDTYVYFGCEPGAPTYRYDIVDAVNDPEGPFLCAPKIVDCRSDITTQALQGAGWAVTIDEREEVFKIEDLEKKIFTPHRNRVMCEAFLSEAQRDPTGAIGKSIVFAVNQAHATAITQILNELRPGIAVTITSRVRDASSLAKEFRDGRRSERVAVSVDMLSTGYNCRDLLNVVLMRPIFSPTEYIQIKGRGTRLFTFVLGSTEYEKKFFFLLDFCAVAEYFEETYDYAAPLALPPGSSGSDDRGARTVRESSEDYVAGESAPQRRDIPVWEGIDRIVTREIRVVGPTGEKVDVMSFRGTFERDLRDFAETSPELQRAVGEEDDDLVETIMEEQFFHRPEMYYATNKLVASYGIPAPTPAFVYHALGRRNLPDKDDLVAETVDSIAARFNLRYADEKWLAATADLVMDDPGALDDFLGGRYQPLFERSRFRALGGLPALLGFAAREPVFDALLRSPIVQSSKRLKEDAA